MKVIGGQQINVISCGGGENVKFISGGFHHFPLHDEFVGLECKACECGLCSSFAVQLRSLRAPVFRPVHPGAPSSL